MIKKYLFLIGQLLGSLSFSSVMAETLRVTNDTDFFVEVRQKDVFSCKEIVYKIKPRRVNCFLNVEKDKQVECRILTYEGAEHDEDCCVNVLNEEHLYIVQETSKEKNNKISFRREEDERFFIFKTIDLEEEQTGLVGGLSEFVAVFKKILSQEELSQEEFTISLVDAFDREIKWSQSQFQQLDFENSSQVDSMCCSPFGFLTNFFFPANTKHE